MPDRIEHDAYQTPVACVQKILPYISFHGAPKFLEPCRGDGNIYDQVKPLCATAEYCEIKKGLNYLEQPLIPADIIITNPPFSLWREFLEKSLQEAATVIYLLRINNLGSGKKTKRKQFWNNNPLTHFFPLSDRPVFVWVCSKQGCKKKFKPGTTEPCECGGNARPSTDMTDYAWYVWDRGGRIKVKDPIIVL